MLLFSRAPRTRLNALVLGQCYFLREPETKPDDENNGAGPKQCLICDKKVNLKSMRTHVAKHIVSYRYGIEDTEHKVQIGEFPCGYCGQTGTCSISRSKPGTHFEATSNCRYFTSLTVRTKAQSSKSNPSTNRPIPCELCLRLSGGKQRESSIIWSYNMERHVTMSHPDELSRLPEWFEQSFTITDEELVNLKLKQSDQKQPRKRERELAAGEILPHTRQRLEPSD
ncbi:unnamed protein product [Rhizoctonia solani]|uniref:Uncharacterized protein n=1 Tax=Rhizoctonia solani TaxID=456999 RepID=A0A8H3E4L5_9AGAM|nr:unnamed protein product [Rhizoctonia solani]